MRAQKTRLKAPVVASTVRSGRTQAASAQRPDSLLKSWLLLLGRYALYES